MELAEAGAIDEVWSKKRDRLFRRRLYRLQLEEDLKDLGVRLRSLDDTGNRFVDAIKDEYAEEEREVIRERARQGEVVAGIPPYTASGSHPTARTSRSKRPRRSWFAGSSRRWPPGRLSAAWRMN
jgi:hypothetical protein